jgi:hypothetical protein
MAPQHRARKLICVQITLKLLWCGTSARMVPQGSAGMGPQREHQKLNLHNLVPEWCHKLVPELLFACKLR